MLPTETISQSNAIALAREVARRCYREGTSVEPAGVSNNPTFRLHLSDNSDRILKFASGTRASSVRKELTLLALLQQHGIPVAKVDRADPEGEQVGIPFWIAYSAGRKTVTSLQQNPDGTLLPLFEAMGYWLAKTHAIAFPKAGEIEGDRLVPRDWEQLLARLHKKADKLAELGLIERDDARLFASLKLPNPQVASLCHGDFHGVQCVVDEGKITAIVDWETAWAGDPGIDLAIAHAYLDCYCPLECTQAFFTGYRAVRSLPDDYGRAYLPARMGHVLGLLTVWSQQGLITNVKRSRSLFRAYCQQYRSLASLEVKS